MARIAELAEKKNASPKSNPVLKEIQHPRRELSTKPKSTAETNVCILLNHFKLDTTTQESSLLIESTKRTNEERRRS